MSRYRSRLAGGCAAVLGLLLLVLSGCAAAPAPEAQAVGANPSATPCSLPPVTPPPTPGAVPLYLELDYGTMLHMTGDVQYLDVETWRLEITGLVEQPLSLSYDDLRCRFEEASWRGELDCPGVFVDTAGWSGARLEEVLAAAGVQEGASSLTLYSADGYQIGMSLERALFSGALLAYKWEGQTLPVLHGFPLRVVVPEGDGNYWVKWLVRIEVN